MKAKPVRRSAFLIVWILGAHAFLSAFESSDLDRLKFIGVLVSAGETHVVVVDSTTGRSSGWIRVGREFGKYSIERYEASSQVLFVSRNGVSRGIPLVEAKTISSGTSYPFGKDMLQVFADSVEHSDGRVTFRGNVTVFGTNLHASAASATLDQAQGGLRLDGSVQVQNGSALIKGEHVKLKAGEERNSPNFPQPAPAGGRG